MAMLACLLVAASVLAGCAIDRIAHADALAAAGGLQREQVRTDSFVLTAFVRIARPDKPLTIYIEGDGLAWLSRNEPSADPTPRQATGLALAAVDPAPNVVYLARPCQFTSATLDSQCGVPYWTSKRFAPEVVASIDEAVAHFAARVPGQSINLVGYSGGAALAVMVAAQRSDIASIRTVAGNLDDEFITRLHRVSSMPQSENPMDYAKRVRAIPQIHFSGADDTVVPPEVARRFTSATGERCAQVRVVPHASHEGDWAQLWPTLLAIRPTCWTPAN